jgi:hypothetical protein
MILILVETIGKILFQITAMAGAGFTPIILGGELLGRWRFGGLQLEASLSKMLARSHLNQ